MLGFSGGFKPEMDPRPQVQGDPSIASWKDICLPFSGWKAFGCRGNDISGNFLLVAWLLPGLLFRRLIFFFFFLNPQEGGGSVEEAGDLVFPGA